MHSIADLLANHVPLDTEVEVRGWVRSRRDSKAGGGLSFIQVHDGSCFAAIQVVASGQELANYDHVQRLTTGCSVVARGKLVASQGKGQSVEVLATRLEVVGLVDDPDTYPITPKHHSFEYLRTVAHLRPRTNTFGAVARVRHALSNAIHRFFHERGFLWVHTPIITASDCEGAGAMFKVTTLDLVNRQSSPTADPRTGRAPDAPPPPPPPPPDAAPASTASPATIGHRPSTIGNPFDSDFFKKPAYLTVSGQLNVECYACALSKVYTFGPTFRAENSNTTRHLSEFWMVEPEVAFNDLAADADLAEAFLKFIFKALLEEREDDMRFFAERVDEDCVQRLTRFVDAPFVRMDYTQAVQVLERAAASGTKFEYPVKWGVDLQSEHERYLTETHVGRPVVLMNYPKEIKAFYMRLNDDGRTVAAMDVLAPGIGEIIGGSQREERLDVLDARLEELRLDKSAYGWYRDLRRYGSVPHAGFGLGLERTIQYATGMANIRDVIPFPRYPGYAEF